MIIKYRGGPLNRRQITGPHQQPKYRDAAGNPIDCTTGADNDLARRRRKEEAASRAAYIYNPQHCRYDFISVVFTETNSEMIARLLELAAEHPEDAQRIEAEIRRIERLSAPAAESAA